MLVEQSYGLTFFLKSSKNEKIRHIYLRITVDGIQKKRCSIQRKQSNFRLSDYIVSLKIPFKT